MYKRQAIGLQGLPDIYEQARGLLNLPASKEIGERFTVKLKVKNLLNSEYLTQQTYKENVYRNESHKLGTTFSFGLSYTIK